MTNNEKKKWLLAYRELMDEIEREAESAGYWRDKAYSISAINWDNFGIRSSTHGNPLVQMLDLAQHCAELGDEAIRKRDEIIRVIDSLEDSNERRLLKLYYIDKKNLLEIGQKMGYSAYYIRHLHRKALTELEIPEYRINSTQNNT